MGYEDFAGTTSGCLRSAHNIRPGAETVPENGLQLWKEPVNEHNGWNGSSWTTVQGNAMPVITMKSFRVIGFPAIVEHHITAGIGYEFSPKLALNLGYMHAFSNTIKEQGTDLTGQVPVGMESTLSQNGLDFGLTWRF